MTVTAHPESHPFLPEKVMTHEMAIAIALAVITTAGNLLVIVALYKDPFRELRTTANYLLVNLAVADLIMGLVVEPIWALQYWVKENGSNKSNYSIAVNVILVLAVEASNLTVLSLTIERYIVLERPLQREALFSGKAVKISIFLIWLTALVISSLIIPFRDQREYTLFLFAGMGVFLLLIMLGLYIRMFIIIRKFNKSLLAQGAQAALVQPGQAYITARKREQQVAKAIFLFYGTFALCWLPSVVVETIKYREPKIDEHICRGLMFLGLFNSALNPVLYTFRMPSFWRAIKRMFNDFKVACRQIL
ncbi:beta-4C adrenergic receptor-like [Orbicella faveolata]|uniref:beta-4C adrenergic receptor-like n=1 Tax=Orbicella faveolata TaxID=48498 RepID=UPI0009E1E643|nr:beta-4C adrenergic receptor-like [Orbicella faveolata]XP_020628642.1 beta-4C adrenergic receptor-like [Orbicella faveolata]